MKMFKKLVISILIIILLLAGIFCISGCANDSKEREAVINKHFTSITDISYRLLVIERYKSDKGYFIPKVRQDIQNIETKIRNATIELNNEKFADLKEDIAKIYSFQSEWASTLALESNWSNKNRTVYPESEIIDIFVKKYNLKYPNVDEEKTKKIFEEYIKEYNSIIAANKKERICYSHGNIMKGYPNLGQYVEWVDTSSIYIKNGILRYTHNVKYYDDINLLRSKRTRVEVDYNRRIVTFLFAEVYDMYGNLIGQYDSKLIGQLREQNVPFERAQEELERVQGIKEYLKSINEYNI